MKSITNAYLVFLFTIVFGLGVVGVSSSGSPEETQKTFWKISGELEEACKCDAACPCWFVSKPTHMNCGGQLVYFITKGMHGNTPVDGLAFARMGQGPDGKIMFETHGNWIFDYLYIDERANAEQRKALEEIAWGIEPKASENVKVQYVPITRTIEGNEHHIKIGPYGSFSAHLIESMLGGAPKIMNAPGADPIRASFQQGRTSSFIFTDASQNWNSKNSNYMYTNFEIDSKQYEEFYAKMMQQMEEMKKKNESEHKH